MTPHYKLSQIEDMSLLPFFLSYSNVLDYRDGTMLCHYNGNVEWPAQEQNADMSCFLLKTQNSQNSLKDDKKPLLLLLDRNTWLLMQQ